MQAYFILPLLYIVFIKIFKDIKKAFTTCTCIILLVSISLYILPVFEDSWKFYYLPFMIFEIAVGSLVFLTDCKLSEKYKKIMSVIVFVAIIYVLCVPRTIVAQNIMLFSVVILSALFIYSARYTVSKIEVLEVIQKLLSGIGKRSYSIYIWHQFIIAFFFYALIEQRNIRNFAVFILITSILSVMSYKYVEIPLGITAKNEKKVSLVIAGSIAVSSIICLISFKLYMNAGIVRDIPELNISEDNVHRHMHAEYCDRPYKWDYEFTENGKLHILVLGNSFARDWANILYEYDTDSNMEISYFFYPDEKFSNIHDRIANADYVFYAEGPGYNGVPEEILNTIPEEKLYIIGNKSYGESNGIIYAKRLSKDYFNQSVKIPNKLLEQNLNEAEVYGTHYIDLLSPIQKTNETIYVFTDNNKFISQDCKHLTQAGAQYYARLLQLDAFFNVKTIEESRSNIGYYGKLMP